MPILRNLAGIYAGTVKVRRTERGYFIDGSYSQMLHPEALHRVLEDADVNGDKIITGKETNNLKDKMFVKYAQ